jgi:beta-lysine 5,6-aminomutase beta subunit
MNVKKVDLSHLKPYGDQMDDGAVQLSFTLPVANGPKAREAARQIANKMGLMDVQIVFSQDLKENFSFFVVYGHLASSIDYNEIKVMGVETPKMTMEEVDEYIKKHVKRPIVVVGATIGTDAHTVGLDSILNMKGYHGDSGLERYKMFKVYNLGSQVSPSELARKVRETKADVVLVSQIVTQRNIHVKNLVNLVDILEAEGLRKSILLIAGGPRITHELAIELGYDAGFGSGTLPSDVASYIATEISKRVL